jgi:hypothetical protein
MLHGEYCCMSDVAGKVHVSVLALSVDQFQKLAAAINARDVPHAGLKVVSDTPFKYLAVHVVDKGAPLYDAPPK